MSKKLMLDKSKNLGAVSRYIAGAVFFITLVVFKDVILADFVMWDDDLLILGNQKITSSGIWWAFTDVDSMQRYNPLTFLSWAFTWRIAGFDPFWFHLVSWLCHGGSAFLLFLILRHMLFIFFEKGILRELSPLTLEVAAALGALLWGLHPLRVEPVAWVSDRTYCQAMFFLLWSLFCYLKAYENGYPRKRGFYFWFSLFTYICSLLSYSLGITFFVVFFLIDLVLLKSGENNTLEKKWLSINRVLAEKWLFAMPAFIVGICAVMIRYRQSAYWSPPVPLSEFGLLDRLMQSMYVWGYYLWKPLWPVQLAPIYTSLISFDSLSFPFLLSTVLVISVSAFCLLKSRRWPFLCGLWFLYMVLLLPFLGIFEHPHFHSDRYSYLPSLCLSLLVALLVARLVPLFKLWKMFAVMSVILAMLSWQSFRQIKVWKNSETLFTYMIRLLGDDPYRIQILGRLASYYQQVGQTEKSVATLKELLTLKPESYKANSQLASVYCMSGRYAAAVPYYRMMIKLDPANALNFPYGKNLETFMR